jgi:4-hydroxy-2-oxoheptanedioate aldolase
MSIVPSVLGKLRQRRAFPPLGERSANRGCAQRTIPARLFFAAANHEIAYITTIEGRGELEHAEAIVSTPGVDALFIGPVDLSASLGFPGEVDHPTVESAVTALIGAARLTRSE